MLPESTWTLSDNQLVQIIDRIDEHRRSAKELIDQLYEKDSLLYRLREDVKNTKHIHAEDEITFCTCMLKDIAYLLGIRCEKHDEVLLDAVRRWKADVYDAEHQPGVDQFDVFLGDLELPKLKDYIRPDAPEKQD